MIKVVKAFGTGKLGFVIFHSKGGLSKSFLARKYVKDAIVIKGHISPMALYMTCFKNPESLIIFDDVDQLLQSKVCTALLKQICDTDDEKLVTYTTTSKLDGEPVPPRFISKNKVLILANDIKRVGKNIGALLSRSHLFHFCPENDEIFAYLKDFSSDKEVLGLIESNLSSLPDFSLRTYVCAVEMKLAGLDWKRFMLDDNRDDRDSDLLDEIVKLPIKKRNKVWCENTGLSVRSLQRALKKKGY